MCSAGAGGEAAALALGHPRAASRGQLTLALQGEELDAPPDTAEDLRDEVGDTAELGDTRDSCPGLPGTLGLPFPPSRCCSSTPTAPSATPPPAPT